MLADKPLDFKTVHFGLSCLSFAPTFDAVIIDQYKSWPSVEQNRTRVLTNIFSFCILKRMDAVNGVISINPNDQCMSKRKDCKGEVLKF